MELAGFYEQVARDGSLMTPEISKRWTYSVLHALALNVDKKVRRNLQSALPEELSGFMKSAFWLYNALLGIRNTNITALEFQNLVARRAGNSDWQFAKIPTVAVFGAMKQYLSSELNNDVAESLSPELRELWHQAEKFAVA